MTQNERRLSGAVALVTGASRGIGKGIAIELGRADAIPDAQKLHELLKQSAPAFWRDVVGT